MLLLNSFPAAARLGKEPIPAHPRKTGASESGSTDDTSAIQNAINATPGGVTVTLPCRNPSRHVQANPHLGNFGYNWVNAYPDSFGVLHASYSHSMGK